MSGKPISPLRRRMIEDMTVREISEKTQSHYIRHVKNFTMFLGRSPDTASWRCSPLRESAPRAYRLKASNAASSYFNRDGDIPTGLIPDTLDRADA